MSERPPFEVPAEIAAYVTVHWPDEAAPPILSGPVRAAVHEWVVEIGCEKELAAVNCPPRRTGLLGGPPGTGKTTLAHHFAARLGLPLMTVNASVVSSKWAGETGHTIVRLFKTFNRYRDRCLPFFDEFDSLATKRSDGTTGLEKELNSIVNAILQNVDTYKGILLAATNRGEEIDEAIWRRFDVRMEIGLPDVDARFAIIKRYLAPFELPDAAIDVLCEATEGATPALLRQLMEGVKRDLVLGPRFKRPPFPQAVFARQLVSIQPHPQTPKPPLWSEGSKALEKIARIPWPPALVQETPQQEPAA